MNRRGNTPKAGDARVVRVAIYTRQSVEDAKSPYGSLAAQRDAVSAYVASQRERGWQASATRYDDAGFSGSTLDRPAFKRLMDDVRAGLIDVIAVYKFDRLSRSQMGFLKTIEELRGHGVAFVSVTQSFDTESIPGRAMLGILGVFGQMERETISERTKDKIHATRRRGMWTGGAIPLGYNVVAKRLVVNATEATQVRSIFSTFLERGGLIATVEATNARGIRTKTWTTKKGAVTPAREFTKATLRALLLNPVYIGRVRLGSETFQGEHEAIVSNEMFESVAGAFDGHGYRGGTTPTPVEGRLLRGLLRCTVCGSSMGHHSTIKRNRRYSSYVCATASKRGASACPRSRVSALDIEAAVVDHIRAIGRDPELIEHTIVAARRDLDARIPALEAEARRHEADRAQLEVERRNVVDAIARGAGASLDTKLAEIEHEIAAVTEHAAAVNADRERLMTTVIDEGALRRALAEFDGVWTELAPREREHLLSLLIDSVHFDSRSREVRIEFRDQGVLDKKADVA